MEKEMKEGDDSLETALVRSLSLELKRDKRKKVESLNFRDISLRVHSVFILAAN